MHRDVSPPNIFLTHGGVAKLLDFGVAKARGATQKTRTGTVKGKNSYMSPEQILGQEVDRRSDIFSIGIVLWEALAARRLFSRETDFLTFQAITDADAPDIRKIRTDVDENLAAVLHKSLAREREDRYSTTDDLKEALIEAMPDYLHPEPIAIDVKERFSKELASKRRLTTNITEQLKALSPADEAAFEHQAETRAPAASTPGPSPEPPVVRPDPEIARQVSGQVISTATKVEDTGVTAPANPIASELLREVKKSRRISMLIAVGALLALGGAAIWVSAERSQRTVASPGPAASSASGGPEHIVKPDTSTQAAPPQVAAIAMDAAPPERAPAPALDATATTVEAHNAKAEELPTPKADKRPSYLTVDSSPYATIFIDGKKVGVTPIFKHKLKAGSYRMRAVSATGEKQSVRIRLKPGRTKNLGRLKWK